MLADMKFKTKLFGLMGALAAPMLLGTFSCLVGMEAIDASLKTVYEDRTICVIQLEKIVVALYGIRQDLSVLGTAQGAERADILRRMGRERGAAQMEWQDYLKTRLTEDERNIAGGTDIALREYYWHADRAASLAAIGSRDETAKEVRYAEDEVFAELVPKLDSLIDIQRRVSGAEYRSSDDLFETTAALNVLIALLGLGVSLAFAAMIIRSINAPLASMVASMSGPENVESCKEIDGVDRQDEIGRAARAVALFKMNTVLRQTQQAERFRALEEHLQQAQRMEAVGQLAGGIAHDFNNIMGAILGYAGFLLSDLPDDTPQHRFAERITAASKRARDLVLQILTFARGAELERTPNDVSFVVLEACDLLRSCLPSSSELMLDAFEEPLVAEVNPAQITQIVVNLGVNASDALTGSAGQIRIGVSRVTGEREEWALRRKSELSGQNMVVRGKLNPGKTYARLTMSDTGCGMVPAQMARMFEPFYTTKRRGTGMGLSVVQGVVADCGGALIVESLPGEGTTFAVYIPLFENGELWQTPEPIPATFFGNEHVLVVDDESCITEIMDIGLGRLGYHVTAFNDSVSAAERFEAEPSEFDVVIVDQVMPELTGRDFLRRIKAVRPSIPVIFCTGFSDDTDEKLAREAGAQRYFLKPVGPDTLAVSIRELCA